MRRNIVKYLGKTTKDPVGEQAGRFSESTSSDAKSGEENVARKAGLGFLMITGAKVWFMVMGAAVNIGLPMVMGPAEFGVYSIVVNTVSWVNMVVVTATLQAVAKLISERPERAKRLLHQGMFLQLFVGVPTFVIYLLGAGLIADGFNDPSLTPLLRLSGGIILSYAFYAIFVGFFNGLEEFGKQALLDVTFATIKTVLILGAVLLGLGVTGAVGGFVAAALAIVFMGGAMAFAHSRKHVSATAVDTEEDKRALKRLAFYLVLVMLYTFGINGVLRADLFLLKSLLSGLPEGVGLDADAVAGIYAAMLNLSRLPYQAVIAVTFVIFPMISKATFESDLNATRSYIRQTLRYSFVLLLLLGVLVSGNAREIVLVLYGVKYIDGVAPLMLLSLATIGFALFFITTTMITGAGKPLASVLLAIKMLAITAVLNWLLIKTALGAEQLQSTALMNAAATATAISMVGGCAAAVLYLVWRYRAGLSLLTLLRGCLISGVVFVGLVMLPGSEELGRVSLLGIVIAKSLVAVLIFGGGLMLMREFGAEDLDRVRRIFRKKS